MGPNAVAVKICGLTQAGDVAASVEAGARYVGLNFFPASPRCLAHSHAAALAALVPPGMCKVALTVDANNDTLDALLAAVPVDMLQLHGGESPARVAEVRRRYGLPVIKALGVSDAADLPAIDHYAGVADQLLIDARPPRGAVLPGGNGVPFDWDLIAGRRWPVPWLLAGGLTAANVAEAIRRTGARQVDVSSGVESAPGHKDPAAVLAFLRAAAA